MNQLLSPKQLAEAIGVSESSLKRWADDGRIHVAKTAGGHRRIALAEAIRCVREMGLPVLRPEKLGLGKLDEARTALVRRMDRAGLMADALRDGGAAMVRNLVVSLYLEGIAMVDLLDDCITPAMHRVGELWEHHDDGIFVEHRATDVMVAALGHLRGLMPPPPDDAPLALGGGMEDDPYILPSLMSSLALGADGWNAVNLGPDTPTQVLAEAAFRQSADLVWLSCSSVPPPARLRAAIIELAGHLAQRGVHLVVGGRGLPPLVESAADNLYVGRSMAELQAFARGCRRTFVARAKE